MLPQNELCKDTAIANTLCEGLHHFQQLAIFVSCVGIGKSPMRNQFMLEFQLFQQMFHHDVLSDGEVDRPFLSTCGASLAPSLRI